MKYISRTDKEIHQIARDYLDGKIFATWHGDHPEDAFITLKNPELVAELQAAEIYHVYQYLWKAGPNKVNDKPMFTTFEVLNRYDVARLTTALHRMTTHKA